MSHLPSSLHILCLYFDRDESWLELPPEEVLSEHRVTSIHTYLEAKRLLENPETPLTFDIIIADVAVPRSMSEEDLNPATFFPTLLLLHVHDCALVRGFGIFVPRNFTTTFDISDGFNVMVTTKECWDPMGHRDWRAMLNLILETWEKADVLGTTLRESNPE